MQITFSAPINKKNNPSGFGNTNLLDSAAVSNPNFLGLNRTLSKKAFSSAEEIKNEVVKHVRSRGIVGNLPKEWVDKIPKAGRAEKIKALYADFKDIFKGDWFEFNLSVLQDKLNKSLRKAGIIDDKTNLEIKSLNGGGFGWCYQLVGAFGNKFKIKKFHNLKTHSLDCNEHGNFAEMNKAAFWQRTLGRKTQKAQFYFGDAETGYMVGQYVDNNDLPPRKTIQERFLGLYYDLVDKKNNSIAGYDIEFGDLKIVSAIAQNKVARKIYKKIDKLPKEKRQAEFDRMFEANLGQKDSNVFVGLASVLGLLPEGRARIDSCTKLLKIADSKVKVAIAFELGCFEKSKYVQHQFVQALIKDSDDTINRVLVPTILSLPTNARRKGIKSILKSDGTEAKKELAKRLNHMPKSEAVLIHKILEEEKVKSIKMILANNIISSQYIPTYERLNSFLSLMRGVVDEDLIAAILEKSVYLDKCDNDFLLNELLETFPQIVKKAISAEDNYIPQSVKQFFADKNV